MTIDTITAQTADKAEAAERRDAFAGRLFEQFIGTMEVMSIYLGDRLGLYAALAEGGPSTPTALAARAGTAVRYTREWLEQQAVAGILTVEDAAAEPEARRYTLPPGHDEVLLHRDSLSYLAPFARFTASLARPLDELLAAFRSGAGVPYTAYGPDAREGQADANRPQFVNLLTSQWLPAVPDVHLRLRSQPDARVAEIGCGAGWASIALAHAYPGVRIDGFDLDEASIALARANAAQAGLAGRVAFHVQDAADPALAGRYDLALAFECIHDMSRPVEVLAAMRRLIAPGGAVIVADERADEQFSAPGDATHRMFYGWSVLFCLPTGLDGHEPVGTGTVMRPSTLRGYAEAAGFREVEVLPIENDLWRFYRLHP